jgi:hypothetical protein
MRIRRIASTVLILSALTGGSIVLSAGSAMADAGPRASCMGQEASSVAPAGSSDEFAGGMREFTHFIQQAFPDVPPGAIRSTIAKLHEGSHEACDAALG